MSLGNWFFRSVATALIGAAWYVSAWAQEGPKAEASPKTGVFVREAPTGNPGLFLFVADQAQGASGDGELLPTYWIGLSCDGELGPALRAQLDLPQDQGLIVRSVVKDSPAEKAGFKEHDILIAAAGQPLKTLPDLVSAVQTAKESELTIDLLRGGKAQSIKLTPAKRTDEEVRATGRLRMLQEGQNPNIDWRWFKAIPGFAGQGPGAGFEMLWPQPGVMVAPGVGGNPAQLPADMSLSITKQGTEPAKIVVKQGEESWETTEDKLSDLPNEVRANVEGFLGRHPLRMVIANRLQPGNPPAIAPPFPAPGQPSVRSIPNQEDRLQQLQNELRRLQDAVEQLRKESKPKPE